jgi:hypothetical protein
MWVLVEVGLNTNTAWYCVIRYLENILFSNMHAVVPVFGSWM